MHPRKHIFSSGKKTLQYDGEILVNGHPRDIFFQRVIGYCPQECTINANLTVRETLTFCARLKAQHDDEAQICSTVNWVLESLSLTEVAEQRIGDMMNRGISGGQKRRVCIGRSMVGKPGILFLDEPTSGLSATDSLLVMECIRNISKRYQMTVVSVMHQPRNSVFNKFEHLILLTGGKCAFNGRASTAIDYFKSIRDEFSCPAYTNPADFFLDVITEGSTVGKPKIIVDYYESNVKPEVERQIESLEQGVNVKDTISYRPKSIVTAPLSKQLWQLFDREIKLNIRDPQKITAKAANAVVMGLLIGMMYFRVKPEYVPAFGYIALAITSMSAMVSLPSFFGDRLMLNLERTDSLYTTLPYFLVNSGVGLIVSVVANAVFATIVWGMVDIGWNKFPKFFLVAFVIFWATDGLITLISACCRTMEQSMAVFNMTIGIFLLFNGYSANTKTTPPWLSWICFLSPLYYSMEMFLDSIYEHDDQMWSITGEVYGMKRGSYWKDFFICLAIGFFGRFSSFFAMKYLHKIQR